MDMPTQYFVFSTSHIYLLFQPWYITTSWQFALAFICVFFGALLFEYLKIVQARLSTWEQQENNRSTLTVQQYDGETQALLAVESERTATSSATARTTFFPPLSPRSSSTEKRACFSFVMRFARSLLHAVQITLSYFLMVVVMTFNAGLLFAIIGGAAVGYYWWFTCEKQSCPPQPAEHKQSAMDLEVPSNSGIACH